MRITKRQLRRIIREEKKGLWANIHAKKKRGEKSNPRTKAYQDAKKAGQKINRDAKKEADSMYEAEDQNDDNNNDFEDVKIARMKASGMSDAEIKKKHPELFETKGAMKITKRQLRRIIREEKARLLKEAPAGQHDQRLASMFQEAIIETVYDVAVEQGLYEPDGEGGQNLTQEAIMAAAAALSDAAREFYSDKAMKHDMPAVKIGR